jgi:hypothetical protein
MSGDRVGRFARRFLCVLASFRRARTSCAGSPWNSESISPSLYTLIDPPRLRGPIFGVFLFGYFLPKQNRDDDVAASFRTSLLFTHTLTHSRTLNVFPWYVTTRAVWDLSLLGAPRSEGSAAGLCEVEE